MKKKFTFLIAALMLLAFMTPSLAGWGQAPVNTVLWAETWNGGSANQAPATYLASNEHTGTTIYGNATISYAINSNTNTKLYTSQIGSGAPSGSPELLLAKKNNNNVNGVWTISGIPTGNASIVTFSFYTNQNNSCVLSTSTSGVTIGSKTYNSTTKLATCDITINNGVSDFNITFTNSTSSNARVDDLEIKVKTAGSSSTTTPTTVIIDDTNLTNTNVYTSTAAGSLSATVKETESGDIVSGATVTWSGDNDDVATINATTGVVTLVAAGTVTFTASYEGDDDYNASSADYEMTVTNENPNLTTIWSEDFSSYVANDVPSGGTYSYACVNGDSDTKIYNEKLAGGDKPELLVGKSGGSFTATIPLLTSTYCYNGDLTLSFKTNNTNIAVSTTTTGVTVSGTITSGTNTLTLSGVTTTTENVVIAFTNSNSSNVRLDDIVLKGEQAALTTVATPVISPDGGAVVSGTEVTITCATEGASIYYTTDGSTPTSSSTAYNPSSKPTITTAMTLKAIAVKDGMDNSNVAEATYTVQYILTVGIDHVDYLLFNYHDETWDEITVDAEDHALVPAGVEVRISVDEVEDCYALQGFNVVYGNTSVDATDHMDEDGTYGFIMPASNATLSAVVPAVTYTIRYSVNGAVVAGLTETVNCGNNATLPSTGISVPEGYTFAGWRTSESSNTVVSSYTPTADATLFAVFASNITTTKTFSFTIHPADFNKQSYNNNNGDHTSTATATTGETMTVTWTSSNVMLSNDGESIQWRKSPAGSLSATNLGTIISVDIDEISTDALTLTISNGSFNITNNGSATGYASTVEVVFEKSTTPSYTLIEDVTGTKIMANIEASHLITVKNGGVLTLTGSNNGTAANLIVEDGGQLITSNAVNATVQKTVAGYGAKGEDTDGWTFIASPVGGVNPEDVPGMIDGDFDLYRFNDGSELEWENWKQEGLHYHFNLENGLGYLYANEDDANLNFAGTVNPSTSDILVDLQYTEGKRFAGWNLVGNPFTAHAYITGRSYFRMKKIDGKVCVDPETVASGAISPCEGVMVQAVGASDKVTFTTTEPDGSINNGNVQIALAQTIATRGESSTQTLDNAIVSFNEGSKLGKFYFGQQNANIYIPQGNEEYAIVSAGAQGEMPVNFKANENGEYTLTVNPENVEMNYLHLIDNMTGTDVDLLVTPSYTFNARTSDYASRFRLVFSANGLNNENGNDDFAFISDGQIILTEQGTVQVYDITGRMISSHNNVNHFAAEGMAAGVYVLMLNNGDNIKTQKIVIK